MKRRGSGNQELPDAEFVQEVDEFLASLPEELERVERIARQLPPSFHEALARKRRVMAAQGGRTTQFDWGVIAVSTAIAAALVGVLFIVALSQPADDPAGGTGVAKLRDLPLAEPAEDAVTFIVTILPDGEPEIMARNSNSDTGPQTDDDQVDELIALGPALDDLPVPDLWKPRADRWFLHAPRAADAPQVADASWPLNDIDRFVLAGLEENGLRPVADAERLTWLRRACYDLTGLPPSRELVERFLHNPSPAAYGSVVDELMAKWQFGEHWASHWLDEVVRHDPEQPEAWRYREYVIASLNADKPFDQFLREQLAGDLSGAGDLAARAEAQIGTGFLALAGVVDGAASFQEHVAGQVDRQIGLAARVFLGMNLAPSRVGEHPLYPVSARDYHALAGIFYSTRTFNGIRHPQDELSDPRTLLPLELDRRDYPVAQVVEEQQREIEIKRLRGLIASSERRLARARERRESERVARLRTEAGELRGELRALHLGARDRVLSAGSSFAGVSDHRRPRDFRGVPRAVLGALAEEVPEVMVGVGRSGRSELAGWLADDHHPLTARVFVNRVWAEVFGQGLVRTVDEIGTPGELPSHPELLDTLALRFVRDGWSVKQLVREMVMSRTYRLSATALADNLATDPDNRLLWRHAPRSLRPGEVRDAVVAVGGMLAGDSGNAQRMFYAGEYAPVEEVEDARAYRSIYLAADQIRPVDDEFVFQSALAASRQLLATSRTRSLPLPERVGEVFLATLSRQADVGEMNWALDLVTRSGASGGGGTLGSSVRPDLLDEHTAYLESLLPRVVLDSPSGRSMPHVVSWAMLYHALMKTDEFRRVR